MTTAIRAHPRRPSRRIQAELWRAFPWDSSAAPHAPGGALWCPRELQGRGRHDAPDRFGALYLCEQPLGCVVEALLPFRGRLLSEPMLLRRGLPLALCRYELADEAEVVDLDDPATLLAEGLRPSQVATRRRAATQEQARSLHAARGAAVGLRWWSAFEASWINVTLFAERATPVLGAGAPAALGLGDPLVAEAADALGMAVPYRSTGTPTRLPYSVQEPS